MFNHDYLIEKARAKGIDREYLDWLRLWPSCLTGTYSHWDDGVGYSVPCHTRHVSHGAGTGIKPEYWAVPLTHDEHDLTHRKGDSVFYAPEWWDEQCAEYLCKWINGVMPPTPGETKGHWKKEYTIHSAGHILALWLMLKKFFEAKKDGAVKITIQRAVKRRSNQQNKAQWKVIYGHVHQFYRDNPNALLRDGLAWLQLACDNGKVSADFIHELCKGLHNEGKSTAKLSTMESAEYFKEIRRHLYDQYNHEFPEIISPDDYA